MRKKIKYLAFGLTMASVMYGCFIVQVYRRRYASR